MTTATALDRLDLSVDRLSADLELLDDLETELLELDAEELVSVLDRFRLWNKLRELHRVARALELKAFRVEVLTLWQLSRFPEHLRPANVAPAIVATLRRFSEMERDYVVGELDKLQRRPSAPSTFARNLAEELAYLNVFRRFTSLEPDELAGRRAELEARAGARERAHKRDDLIAASRTILDELAERGEAFTISAAATALLEELGLERGQYEGLEERAAREIVSQAIRDAQTAPAEYPRALAPFPPFVTFELDGEWLRLPAENATVGQLRQMAHYRTIQAEQVAAAARELAAAAKLAAELAATLDPRPADVDAIKLGALKYRVYAHLRRTETATA